MSFFSENSSWIIPVGSTLLGSVATHFFTRWRGKRTSKEHKVKDLQKEIGRLHSENEALKEKLKQKESRDEFIATYEYSGTGFYYKPIEGRLPEECYCSKCFDSNGKRIRITIREDGEYTCPECHSTGLYNKQMRDAYFQEHLDKMSDYNQQIQNFLTYGNE